MVNFLSSTALKIFALFSILIETTSAVDSNACSACTSICTIIPPAGSTFPCYEGTPANTKSCYNTDPLIQSGSTYQCTACTDLGYPYYLQNDPVYVNMELWGMTPPSPTAAPTTSGSSPIISFHTSVYMESVSTTSDELDANSQIAVLNATATSMSIPLNSVTYDSSMASETESNAITVITEVSIALYSTSFTDAQELYAALVASLFKAVKTGAYTQTLQSTSLTVGATETASANVTSMFASPMTLSGTSSGSSGSNNSNDALIAALIVITATLGFLLLVAVIVLVKCHFSKNKEPLDKEVSMQHAVTGNNRMHQEESA